MKNLTSGIQIFIVPCCKLDVTSILRRLVVPTSLDTCVRAIWSRVDHDQWLESYQEAVDLRHSGACSCSSETELYLSYKNAVNVTTVSLNDKLHGLFLFLALDGYFYCEKKNPGTAGVPHCRGLGEKLTRQSSCLLGGHCSKLRRSPINQSWSRGSTFSRLPGSTMSGRKVCQNSQEIPIQAQ